MNPQYKVMLSVTLNHPVADKSIELQQVRYLPFVPMDGQVVRVASEDGENQLDLTLYNIVYDTSEGMFVCCLEDDEQIQTYNETGTCNASDLVASYVSFGFTRINYPQGQAIRREQG